jgi:UV excision repair protein RAD23
LDALRDNPQFQQLRQLIQSNPQLLEPIIQNIAQGNPQLAALINQNPEAFLQLLAEGGGEGGLGGALPPGAIQVTPEEAEAIGRVSRSRLSSDYEVLMMRV